MARLLAELASRKWRTDFLMDSTYSTTSSIRTISPRSAISRAATRVFKMRLEPRLALRTWSVAEAYLCKTTRVSTTAHASANH